MKIEDILNWKNVKIDTLVTASGRYISERIEIHDSILILRKGRHIPFAGKLEGFFNFELLILNEDQIVSVILSKVPEEPKK